MGIKLYELIDDALLCRMIKEGYVGVQQHPTEPLLIYNYTHKAQYEKVWNEATRQCRGLIVGLSGTVVARPWPKFFNYGEHTAAAELMANEGRLEGKRTPLYEELGAPLNLDEEVVVTDKLDGSLGILYPCKYGHAIATRGSFTSEQAVRASGMWQMWYNEFMVLPNTTYLFEIIYPENRVVLDYGVESDLYLLDVLNTEKGTVMRGTVRNIWPGPRANRMPAGSLRSALALEPRKNAEGVVVRYDSGLMIKIKQDDYVALHRIVTGLNERAVWERLGAGDSLRDICEGLPDEFAVWVEMVAVALWGRAKEIDEEVHCLYNRIIDTGPDLEDWPGVREYRKYFAGRAKEHPDFASYLFALHDGHDVTPMIWRNLKPAGVARPRVFDESTA